MKKYILFSSPPIISKLIIIALLSIIFLNTACSGADSNAKLEVITPSERIFTFDDLISVGFKKNRNYDVSDLPGAKDAWFGFWGITRSESKDYEVRFYESHQDAITMGEVLAQEVTGNDAVINKNSTWKTGSKDRRQVGGGVDKGSLGLQATGIFPKYGNYIIYGNMILLCEGQEEIALKTCWDLVKELE